MTKITIGGVEMKKLGKGKPGRMSSLVRRHLGDKAADKVTKSDGAKLMAKAKKTGNTELFRKGSFIKNMMKEEKYEAAITDIDINTRHRNETIEKNGYGPANPDMPGDFWKKKAELWGVSEDIAASMKCNNCAAFDQSPKTLKKIADAIGPDGNKVVENADIGYCELFEFKCAGLRACDAWVHGGPIKEEKVDESMYKSPAHKRLQKFMDKNRQTSSYKNQVKKLGGTPLKPGEQNPMKRTTEAVQIPDKDEKKITKIVKGLKKSVKGHDAQQKYLTKLLDKDAQNEQVGFPDDGWGTTKLDKRLRAATPGQTVARAVKTAQRKEVMESREYQRTKELARAGMVPKKDMAQFEYIMRKMDMGKNLTQKERNYVASIYDDLLRTIIKDPSLFARFRSKARKGQIKEFVIADLEEKVLTKAEKKKREEVAQAIERDNPGMPMAKKMAIATATAKKVAEESCCDDCSTLDEELIIEDAVIMEAGEKKSVKLNKIQRGGSKKFYVYTRNDKGNVVKVSFGDPGLSIKRDDPARRKSFRARHNCDNPGPKWKARYWSCRQWRASSKVEG